MKIPRLERLSQMQREYHRSRPWRLSRGGLFIPHVYTEIDPERLSLWDEVGFILNGRRIAVFWQHPRHQYANAVEEQAWTEAGPGPSDDWLFDGATKNYKQVGKSRKKLVSYTCRAPSAAQMQHYDLLNLTSDRLSLEGINFEVSTSFKWERLTWAMSVTLVAPLEVRNETELAVVAALARRLILGKTSLAKEFLGYKYGRAEWLAERIQRDANKIAHPSHAVA